MLKALNRSIQNPPCIGNLFFLLFGSHKQKNRTYRKKKTIIYVNCSQSAARLPSYTPFFLLEHRNFGDWMCLFFRSFSASYIFLMWFHTIRRNFFCVILAQLWRCKKYPWTTQLKTHPVDHQIKLLFHTNNWINILDFSISAWQCSYKRGSNKKTCTIAKPHNFQIKTFLVTLSAFFSWPSTQGLNWKRSKWLQAILQCHQNIFIFVFI